MEKTKDKNGQQRDEVINYLADLKAQIGDKTAQKTHLSAHQLICLKDTENFATVVERGVSVYKGGSLKGFFSMRCKISALLLRNLIFR